MRRSFVDFLIMAKLRAHYPRILMFLAPLSLVGLFFLPIWRITLEAPQFPEGLYMYIWINQITGSSEYVLQNINILNHYIGMQKIEPDSIPELQYFPYIIIGMIVLGIAAGVSNRKILFLSWFALLSILCLLGLYDFYLWEYDYGHNLDPNAPIKVPGMTYQPPLIGEKKLLNFNAISYPAKGFWFLMGGLVFSFLAYFTKRRLLKKGMAVALVFAISGLSGCTPEPTPIHYGEDVCHSCQMSIVDNQYGAELVSNKGKVFLFDATECVLQYMKDQQTSAGDYAYMLTNTADKPGEFTSLTEATWLHSEQLPSPMGANLSPFNRLEEAKKAQETRGGDLYNWETLQATFADIGNKMDNPQTGLDIQN